MDALSRDLRITGVPGRDAPVDHMLSWMSGQVVTMRPSVVFATAAQPSPERDESRQRSPLRFTWSGGS